MHEIEILKELNQKYCPRFNFERVPVRVLNDPHAYKVFSANRKGQITGIAFKHCEGFALSHFPEELCQFTHLEKLVLRGHQIREIPDCISNLTELKYLNLACNKILELPESFSKLTNLRSLSLSDNPIEGVPECLRYLPLKHLHMNAIPEYRIPIEYRSARVNVLDHIKLSEIEGEITEDKIRKRMASILPYIR